MSFTRSVKLGNIMAKRKLKQKITSERVEAASYVFLATVALLVMNIALLSM